tara:strand:+ start:387 stop:1277 length:891 start_codon:yes stop_codon:yes gene_type:complete
MLKLFAKQIGFKNFFLRGIKKKIINKKIKEKFIYKTITNNNYIIYKWDPSGSEVYMTQCFTDWGNEYLFLDSLKGRKNNIFLDIGCHTGYYPTLFKNIFEKIIGFEPSTKCISILNNLKNDKFVFYQHFVGDEKKIVRGGDSKTGYSFYSNDTNHEQVDFKEISQITLDEFCKNRFLKDITAIKIDVDGIDLKVLYGSEEIIRKNRPSIMIENYSSELFEFFKDLNYVLISMVSTIEKPYNLYLEELKNFNSNKWIKMVCCIPYEYKKNYSDSYFKGNIFSGINKKKILKIFNFKV